MNENRKTAASEAADTFSGAQISETRASGTQADETQQTLADDFWNEESDRFEADGESGPFGADGADPDEDDGSDWLEADEADPDGDDGSDWLEADEADPAGDDGSGRIEANGKGPARQENGFPQTGAPGGGLLLPPAMAGAAGAVKEGEGLLLPPAANGAGGKNGVSGADGIAAQQNLPSAGQNLYRQAVKQLTEKGVPEETARELAAERIQLMAERRAVAPLLQRLNAEEARKKAREPWLEVAREYPDVTSLPESVLQSVLQGERPLAAMRAWELQQLRARLSEQEMQLSAQAATLKNRQTTPGSAAGAAEIGRDAFLDALLAAD